MSVWMHPGDVRGRRMTRRYARPQRDMPYISDAGTRAHKIGITAHEAGNLTIGLAVLCGLYVANLVLLVWDGVRPGQGRAFAPMGGHSHVAKR